MCLSCGTLYERRKDTWVQLTPDEIKALPAPLRAYLGKAKRLRQKIVREDLVLNQKLEDL